MNLNVQLSMIRSFEAATLPRSDYPLLTWEVGLKLSWRVRKSNICRIMLKLKT